MHEIGQKIDLSGVFEAEEGSINFYYGMIRQGKTYSATADIHDDLKRGDLVYATWPIKVSDFDDRESLFMSFINLILFRKNYYKIGCQKNFHFIDAEKGEVDGKWVFDPEKPREYVEYLNKLNHCKLYIDEAWRVIDSYKGVNFDLNSRNLILVTGHKFRVVNIIAQRPTSVHVTARGNVNRFYKVEKIATWPWVRFQRSEFQIMSGETVDETKDPVSVKTYWAKKKIFQSYNSYFYGELDPLHDKIYETYVLKFNERLFVFWQNFVHLFSVLRKKKEVKVLPEIVGKETTGDHSTATSIKKGVGSILQTPSDDKDLSLPF